MAIAAGSERTRTARRDVEEESLMLTGDQNIIDIDFSVQWRISDAGQYLFNIREPEVTVKAAAESAMREIIGRTDIQPALTEARETKVRAMLGAWLEQRPRPGDEDLQVDPTELARLLGHLVFASQAVRGGRTARSVRSGLRLGLALACAGEEGS